MILLYLFLDDVKSALVIQGSLVWRIEVWGGQYCSINSLKIFVSYKLFEGSPVVPTERLVIIIFKRSLDLDRAL